MVGGIGCCVSSMITLLIFFPRSITREAGYTIVGPTQSHSVHDVSSIYHIPEHGRGRGFEAQVERSRKGSSLNTLPPYIISGENDRRLKVLPLNQTSSRSAFAGFSAMDEHQRHLPYPQASPGRLVPLSRNPLPEGESRHGHPRSRADESDEIKDFNPDIHTADIDVELQLEDIPYEQMQAKNMRYSNGGISQPYVCSMLLSLEHFTNVSSRFSTSRPLWMHMTTILHLHKSTQLIRDSIPVSLSIVFVILICSIAGSILSL